MGINTAALRQAKARINWLASHTVLKRNNGRWNQRTWRTISNKSTDDQGRCKTAMCVAGWVVEEDKNSTWLVSPQDAKNKVEGWESRAEYVLANDTEIANGDYEELEYKGKTWKVREAEFRAQDILGLSNEQAYELFDAHNTLHVVNQVIDRILADA